MRVFKSKTVKYLIVFLAFFYLFAAYDVNFHGPDEPTYLSYTASVIEKGDLNIVNLFYRSGKYVSATYNLPAPHCYGGVALWAPFYAYGKMMYIFALKNGITGLDLEGLDRVTKCAMSFSTVLFAFLAILLTYRFLRIFFPPGAVVWSISAIFLGTPFFYYALGRPGNANVISCLFSVISIIFCSYMASMQRRHWFFFGLFYSICVTVKSDLWFQGLFIAALFITLCFLKKVNWKSSLYFLSGFMTIFIFRGVNAYLKYGYFHIEEARFLLSSNLKCLYFFNGLFSPYRGLLFISPVYLICLLGFVLLLVNAAKGLKKTGNDAERMRSWFLFILSGYAVVKLFLFGNDFPEEDFGARFLITEFPVFALLFAQVVYRQKKFLAYLTGLLTLALVGWNLLLISETITGLDWVYVTAEPDLNRFKALGYILPLFYPKELGLKFTLFLPLLPVVLFVFWRLLKKPAGTPPEPSFWYKPGKTGALKSLSLFTAYLCLALAAVTLLNLWNNKKNVEKLKAAGFFQNAQIMQVREYDQEDFFIPRVELMQYYALKGRLDLYTAIRRYKDKYFTKKDSFGNYSNEAFLLYSLPQVASRKRSDYYQAISCLEESIRIDPRDIDSRMNLGLIYSALGENDRARGYFEEVIGLNPDFSHAYVMLGLIYIKEKDCDNAIRVLEEVVKMRPAYADAYSHLGDCYRLQDNYVKAIASYEQAVLSDPTRNWTYSDLAQCHAEQGDLKTGVEYLRKYLYYYPADPKICRGLGDIYVKMRDKKNALKQAAKLRRLKEYDSARELEQSILERLGTWL